MTSKPSAAALRSAAAGLKAPVPTDTGVLQRLQGYAKTARDLAIEIESLEERAKEKRQELNKIVQVDMPDLMIEHKVDVIGIPAEGNLPAYEARVRPFYSANIASSWPVEKREAAFDFLKKVNSEDLIKTKVEISFPRGNLKVAQQLAEQAAKKKGASVDLKETVASQTLTAWLKDQVETHHRTFTKLMLDTLGATIGKKVDLKEVKQKN